MCFAPVLFRFFVFDFFCFCLFLCVWGSPKHFCVAVKGADCACFVFLCWSPPQLANPGELHVRDVITGAIFGIQIYGCFKLGEISVRRNIAGYDTPAPSAATFSKF